MDILFAFIAFLFMLSFLISIRAIVHKHENSSSSIVITSLLFGGLFWSCLFVMLNT